MRPSRTSGQDQDKDLCLTYQELESDWFAEAKSEHADSVRHLGSVQSFTASATPTMIHRKLKITSSRLLKPELVDSTCLCPRPTEHILVNSCKARTLLLLKLDMTQTEMVKRPEGWSANLMEPSSASAHNFKQSRHSCSSARAFLKTDW